MRTVGSSCILGALVVAFGMSVAHAAPVDCEAARCAIASEIDAECPCATAANHGRFTSCVARVVNRAARDGRIPKPCRGKINGCYLRSLCGKSSGAVLCDQAGAGPGGRCRPLGSEMECTRKGGDVVSTCCAACDAATPTPSAPAVTPTPGAPTPGTPTLGTPTTTSAPTASAVATATGVPIATATPTPLATIRATATALAATATPFATTATPVAATTTPIAATATSILATATPLPPSPTAAAPTATMTFAVPTPLATVTPAPTLPVEPPTPTATPFPFLFVGVEAEPDSGPPPLRVRWTSDVSGGTPPYTYRWDFGDGSPDATTPNPVHVYERIGDFTTTLIVEDASGLIESDDWDVTVELD